mgnify:CR=1 FL=1
MGHARQCGWYQEGAQTPEEAREWVQENIASFDGTDLAQSLLDRARLCPLPLLTPTAVQQHRLVRAYLDHHALPYPGAVQDQPAWFAPAVSVVSEVSGLLEARAMQTPPAPQGPPPAHLR